jgi:hypothetical protein
MTALRIAKGIADTMGVPFAVIDTEARSASKYADRIPFDVDDLTQKSIDHYITSMNDCIRVGYKVLVIDSLSHAWRELTEEVDRIAQSSASKNTFSAWGKVGPKQKRLVDAILNFPGHIITTMRSKTEWVIGENKYGKVAPEKMGLAPEQGKGIEYEFDLLIEMNQRHEGIITKDRTGKFQDEVIDKPGEDFGIALYNWLTQGNNDPEPVVSTESTHSTKEMRSEIIQEIGKIITATNADVPYFSELDKADVRNIIKTTAVDEKGIETLQELQVYLAEQLAQKQSTESHNETIPFEDDIPEFIEPKGKPKSTSRRKATLPRSA